MNKSVKLWIKALRSGEFYQGIGALKNDNFYCCLGVACEVYNRTHKKKVNFDNRETLSGELAKVRHWLRLKTAVGDYGPAEDNVCLASENDCKKTFNEIADIIESKPKGLFYD